MAPGSMPSLQHTCSMQVKETVQLRTRRAASTTKKPRAVQRSVAGGAAVALMQGAGGSLGQLRLQLQQHELLVLWAELHQQADDAAQSVLRAQGDALLPQQTRQLPQQVPWQLTDVLPRVLCSRVPFR